jgi:hypothetical protein
MNDLVSRLRTITPRRRPGRVVVTLAAALIVTSGCAGPTFSPPPDAAPAEEVVTSYLRALMRGDCSAGKVLGAATFRVGNGELCGATSVTSFRVNGPAPDPNATDWTFATTLVTTGTADGSIQPGEMTWFYSLRRDPGGRWRLVGGGSGP